MDEIRKRIKSADAVAAYEVLLKGMTDLGLECRRPRKGFVKFRQLLEGALVSLLHYR